MHVLQIPVPHEVKNLPVLDKRTSQRSKWTCKIAVWEVVLGGPDRSNTLSHRTHLCQILADVKMTNN